MSGFALSPPLTTVERTNAASQPAAQPQEVHFENVIQSIRSATPPAHLAGLVPDGPGCAARRPAEQPHATRTSTRPRRVAHRDETGPHRTKGCHAHLHHRHAGVFRPSPPSIPTSKASTNRPRLTITRSSQKVNLPRASAPPSRPTTPSSPFCARTASPS
jgi:hypothetical protein